MLQLLIQDVPTRRKSTYDLHDLLDGLVQQAAVFSGHTDKALKQIDVVTLSKEDVKVAEEELKPLTVSSL